MMKVILLLLLNVLNFSYASSPYTSCLTHGDCQEAHPAEDATKCLKITTGTDALGNPSCNLRCFHVKRSYQCIPVNETLAYGVCVKERMNIPTFNPNEPNCSDALELPLD